MKIAILALLFFLICPGPLVNAEVIAKFDIYLSNPFVLIDNTHLCIWDQTVRKIYLYKRDDYNKIAEFGRCGQGPGEFAGIEAVTMTDTRIIVSSFPKLLFFSKKGEYLKETRCSTESGNFEPFGENYIGRSFPHTNPKENIIKIKFSLYNSKLEKINDIFTAGLKTLNGRYNNKKLALFFPGTVEARIYKDRLYIGSTDKGFSIDVFDLKGNHLYQIRKKLEKRKVTDIDIKSTLNESKKACGEKEWEKYNAMIKPVFPDHFADFENFTVADDKIYVFLYRNLDYRNLLVYDLKGKLLDHKKFPIIKGVFCINRDRFSIYKGMFYYIDENMDEETWELHAINLNE